MEIPLLQTKLYVPQLQPKHVFRSHLVEKMNRVGPHKLILISAPAGFGKSSLVSEWAQQAKVPISWLSLDDADNDLNQFITYLIVALQKINAGLGVDLLSALKSPQPPPMDFLLTLLVNEIDTIETDFALVLDDYQVIATPSIHSALNFLIDRLPARMLVIIAGRADPFLPLSRLRASGQMIEIRADDLRFSADEAATFLNQEMGLALTAKEVASLENRTEGWIAGLQLVAHSIKTQTDTPGFIASFTGDDRYIVDYLVDEVLSQRPAGTSVFLLKTSILDRMSGPLCDAVIEGDDSQQILETLDKANLFIISLDNRRRWYRYHHLFTDLLRQRLRESSTIQEINNLHQRASQWYENKDLLFESVEHAIAGEDYPRAIRLIELGAAKIFQESELNILIRWWHQLPLQVITAQPKLCMLYAWAWLATGHTEKSEECLVAIEETLGKPMTRLFAEMEKRKSLPSTVLGALVEIAVMRGQLAIIKGNIPEALKLSELVLPYLEDDEGSYLYNPTQDSRTVAFFSMGLAYKFSAELTKAEKALTDAAELGHTRKNVHIVAVAYGHIAKIQSVQGKLQQAIETCQQGLQLVQGLAGEHTPMSGLLLAELGNLYYEQNNIAGALRVLEDSIRLAKSWAFLDALIPGYSGLAQIRAIQGNWNAAFETLDELESFRDINPEVVTPAVESIRTRMWLAQGNVEAATQWALSKNFSVDGEIHSFNEADFITFARVLIATKKWGQATYVLDRLLSSAEDGGRWGTVIELLNLQAITQRSQEHLDEALQTLSRALEIAEPNGYVRSFVDEGAAMIQLLQEAVARSVSPGYSSKLLSEFETKKDGGRSVEEVTPIHTASTVAEGSGLIDPLSRRELEVLHLLKSELSGPEIASELTIELSTLRSHTQKIYTKLDVGNRRAAIQRAKELKIL